MLLLLTIMPSTAPTTIFVAPFCNRISVSFQLPRQAWFSSTASAQCQVFSHHASRKSHSPPLAIRYLTTSSSGARLISFSDVIEIKGAAAAAATKEKETKDAELAQLQARECSRGAVHAHAHPLATSSSPQATFGTIPSNGSRIKMPSPVASLMSLSGTEGAVEKLLDGGARSPGLRSRWPSQALLRHRPGWRLRREWGGASTKVSARLLSRDDHATPDPCLQREMREAAAGRLFLLPVSKAGWVVCSQ